MKKALSVVLVVIMLLSITACGAGQTEGTSKSKGSEGSETTNVSETDDDEDVEVKTLTVTTFVDWYKSGWEALEKHINDNADELGFRLEVETIAGGMQGEEMIKVMFATGELPDMLQFYEPKWIDQAVSGLDLLVDMGELESLKDYDQNIFEGKYKYKGGLYGMPMDTTNLLGVIYNKKVFEELGLEVPKNREEFFAVAEKIMEAGKVPLYYAGKDSWTLQSFAHAGFTKDIVDSGKTYEEFWTDMNTNERHYVDNKNFIEAIELSKEFLSKGLVNETFLSDTYDGAQKAVAEGSAAMHINGTWFIDEIAGKYPENLEDLGAFAIPAFDEEYNYVNVFLPSSIGVTTNCEDIELAKKAIDYITSAEAQQIYADAQPGLYINQNITTEITPAHSDLKDIMDAGKVMTHWQSGELYGYGSFADSMQAYYTDAMTSLEVVEAMDEETAKNARANNDSNWD